MRGRTPGLLARAGPYSWASSTYRAVRPGYRHEQRRPPAPHTQPPHTPCCCPHIWSPACVFEELRKWSTPAGTPAAGVRQALAACTLSGMT
eukprot:359547-Chlamydomonas_euryale.AAC.5